MRNDGRPDTREMTLALLAWRYAAGELAPADAAAFAARLSTDAAAQDALAEAVRLSARALGQDPPAPDPLIRSAIIGRLRPAASRLGRAVGAVLRRRPYRGHPVTWAGIGAVAAAGVLGFGTYLADRPAGPSAGSPTTLRTLTVPAPEASPLPDLTRAVKKSPLAPLPAASGGGGVPLPRTPATTFLPPPLGPADPLRDGRPGLEGAIP